MDIGDRVVMQVRALRGRVGTIIEIDEDEDRVAVRLDPGGAPVVWCRLRDVLPLK